MLTNRKVPLPRLGVLLLGLILAILILIVFGDNQISHANPDASISLSTNLVPEGDDFATRVLGQPWDMNAGPYPDFPTVAGNINRGSFSVTNGIWSMTATNSDPSFWMLWQGIQNTQMVLRQGDQFPIDTTKYKLISLRLCSSAADHMNFYWWHDRIPPATQGGLQLDAISDFVNTSNGCKVISVNMETLNTIQGNWNGWVKGIRIDPSTVGSRLSFQLDWIRLTSKDLSNVVPINWSNATSGADLHFYLSKTACGVDGNLVGIVNSASRNGTFNWGSTLQPDPDALANRNWMVLPIPESFEPGQYYVYMRENGTGSPACASSTLQIHKAPILNFQKPSMFSGPDYAKVVVQDQWGMANSEDIEEAKSFSSLNFSNSILYGVNSNGDPRLFLHTTSSIDADIYKYATFRMKIDGQRTGFWVQRFVWWYQHPAIDPVVTQDAIMHEGWHTYSYDLSQAPIESGSRNWTDNPKGLRMDPHEIANPIGLQLDFVTLTGDEIINRGSPFAIVYETNPSTGVTVSFYRDTDRNPNNGRTPLSTTSSNPEAAPQAPAGGPIIYLPLVFGSTPEVNLLTGNVWPWDTAGVPPGTYYISADVDDGVMTTTWYSEIPVIVR